MGRTLRIYRAFWASSLSRDREYRANFIAQLIQSAIWVVFSYLIVEIVFANAQQVAGWNRGQMLAVVGVSMLTGALVYTFMPALQELPEQVRRGTLDFVVTKPVDAQFWVSFRRFNLAECGSVFAALVLTGYGVAQSGGPLDPVRIFAGFVLALIAAGLYYCLMMMTMTLAIYFVRVENLWVLAHTGLETTRFPVEIYKPAIQRVLLFIVPLAFLATVPVGVALRGWDMMFVAYGLGFLALGLALTRWFWRFSLTRYTSASS